MVNGRILFNLTLLACSAWGYFAASALPAAYLPGQIGPGFFPSTVAGLGVLVMVFILIGDLRNARAINAVAPGRVDKKPGIGAAAVVVLLVVYIQMIEPFGFRIATAIFLFLGILICHFTLDSDQSRPMFPLRFVGISALTASVVTLVTYAVFTYGFGLNLP